MTRAEDSIEPLGPTRVGATMRHSSDSEVVQASDDTAKLWIGSVRAAVTVPSSAKVNDISMPPSGIDWPLRLISVTRQEPMIVGSWVGSGVGSGSGGGACVTGAVVVGLVVGFSSAGFFGAGGVGVVTAASFGSGTSSTARDAGGRNLATSGGNERSHPQHAHTMTHIDPRIARRAFFLITWIMD